MQDVYDAVVGSESKDVYLDGMDENFNEWRRLYGAEWAKYYNLRVITQLAPLRLIVISMRHSLLMFLGT